MAPNREKTLQNAEKLLKQGKVQDALVPLERLAETAGSDVLLLNRIGDLLARSGCAHEAIGFYNRISTVFTAQGFYPKAVAIQKKILRLEPANAEALIGLGDLYTRQRLPGEARAWFLKAGEVLVEEDEHDAASEVFQRLIDAEPDDPRHRARLAETRAAAGDAEGAVEQLIQLGESLLRAGKPEESEQAFRRALELAPGHVAATLGAVNCMTETGREDDARELLNETVQADDAPSEMVGELLFRCERQDDSARSTELLAHPRASAIEPDTFFRILALRLEADAPDRFWDRFGAVFEEWADNGRAEAVIDVYSALANAEEPGHVPALQRLVELHAQREETPGVAGALERLVKTYQARSMNDEASLMMDRLREIAPDSRVLPSRETETPEPEQKPAEAPPAIEEPEAVAVPAGSIGDVSLLEAEAPAVPLNRNDEEFVTGRLTQAEILEKYGLHDQAMEQIREVADKFPGLVDAQQRMVVILRRGEDKAALQASLVRLALARRASGEQDAAKVAAAEAVQVAELDESARHTLQHLGLVSDGTTAPATAPAAVPKATSKDPVAEVAADPVLIDFDDDETEALDSVVPVEPVAATPATTPGVKLPGQEMLAEVQTYLSAGLVQDAEQRVRALRSLGYGGEDLDGLAREVLQARDAHSEAEAPTSEPAPPIEETVAGEVLSIPLDPTAVQDDAGSDAAAPGEDDDLAAITAALESELFAEEEDDVTPTPEESEQSLEDVFATFKEHVAEEVGTDDHRTHYDLGIAYKEMGLIDSAIDEFKASLGDPQFKRDASIMLAVCHREQGQMDASAEWYRKALQEADGDPSCATDLRYEFAEVLLGCGDRGAALDQFRNVLQVDPSYRDVQERVAELESSAAS